jgi:CRP-like cAMP-binding protein
MSRSTNRILSACSDQEFSLLSSHLEAIALPLKMDLEVSNEAIEYVYFMESGIASVVASDREDQIEVGIFGRDGMTGTSIVNGADRTPLNTFIQVAGTGFRITTSAFQQVMVESPSLKSLFLLHNEARSVQMAHTALSNGRHTIEERLARWILMCHDRLDGDDLPLTHEFLSLMLGVRRAGVTTALHILEGGLVIRSTRGLIHIRDRARLEEVASNSYGTPEAHHERLMSGELSFA